MSLSGLLKTPCTLIRRADTGSEDVYGNEQAVETTTATVCSLQQRRRDEPEAGGEVSETLWDLFLPSGTAVDTSDGVLVGGAKYQVVGQPWDATEGSLGVHHVEATVKKVAGSEDVS